MQQKISSKRLISLASAMIRLNETIYEPTSTAESQHFLSQSERAILCELRQFLIQISDSANIKLKSDASSTFHQETINEQQMQAIKTVFKETVRSLGNVIELVKRSLANTKGSKSFFSCLTDLLRILEGTLALIQDVGVENVDTKVFTNDNIYQLCRQLGILYIPVNQSLDPFLGGHEAEGKLESSDGECAGKVTSWLEACAQTSEIHYPFYAGKFDGIYHDQQREIAKKYSAVHLSRDLFEFTDVVFNKLKRQTLYKITLAGENSGHALGLRIRQDGVYELFDPNYLHAFAIKPDSLKVIFKYLLIYYAIKYQYNVFGFFAADIVQCTAASNLFPHRLHIIQAENKLSSDNNEQLYKKILIKTYNLLQTEFKKDPTFQPNAQTIFTNLLESFAAAMHSPRALEELIGSMKQINLATSFIQSPENLASMLSGLANRLTHIKNQEFQSEYQEKQVIILTLKKLLEEVTEELNRLKSEQAQHGQPQNEQAVLILIQQSLKLWRMLRTLNTNREQAAALPRKGERFDSRTFLRDVMKDVFGVESQARDITHLQQEARVRVQQQMQTVLQRFSQSPLTDKRLALMMVTENLLAACNSIQSEKQIIDLFQVPPNDLALKNLLAKKLKILRTKLLGFLNELKICEQPEGLEAQFLEILPIQNDTVVQLLRRNQRQDLLWLLRVNACNNITKDELTSLTNTKRPAQTDEIKQLIASLNIVINYIESVRDEYLSSTGNPLLNNSHNAMSLVLAAKIQQRIEQFHNRINELKRCRDILDAQTKNGADPVTFTRIASQIRQNYRGLFPVDFNLPANYVHILDPIIERGKVIVLTAEDKEKVKSLATSLEILKNSHQWLKEYLEQMQGKMKELDEKDRTIAHKTIGLLLTCQKDFGQYLNCVKKPEQILEYVRSLALIIPIKDNCLDFTAYLESSLPRQLLLPKSIKNKIDLLVLTIQRFDSRIALTILKAAYIELTDNNQCALKDYGARMTHALKNVFDDTSLSNNPQTSLLKSTVILLNSLFRGLRGSCTNPFWKELKVDADQQTQDRERLGIAMFMYYRERVAEVEAELNRAVTSRFSFGQTRH